MAKAMKADISASEVKDLREKVSLALQFDSIKKLEVDDFMPFFGTDNQHSWDLLLRPHVVKQTPPPELKNQKSIRSWYKLKAKTLKHQEGLAIFGLKSQDSTKYGIPTRIFETAELGILSPEDVNFWKDLISVQDILAKAGSST